MSMWADQKEMCERLPEECLKIPLGLELLEVETYV